MEQDYDVQWEYSVLEWEYFSLLANLFYPKEGSISFCKTVVPVRQTTWHHNTEDPILNIHCRDNLIVISAQNMTYKYKDVI